MEGKTRTIKETSSLSQSRKGPKTCYGATRNPENAPDFKLITHNVALSDTLQGLAIKYGVTIEQIRRVNKLWTNDNILIYKTLNIPVKVKIDCDEDTDDDAHEEVNLVDIDVDIGDTSRNESSCGQDSQNNIKNGESLCEFLNNLDDQMKVSIEQAKKQRANSGPASNGPEKKHDKETHRRRKTSDLNQSKLPKQPSHRTSNSNNVNSLDQLDDLFEL